MPAPFQGALARERINNKTHLTREWNCSSASGESDAPTRTLHNLLEWITPRVRFESAGCAAGCLIAVYLFAFLSCKEKRSYLSLYVKLTRARGNFQSQEFQSCKKFLFHWILILNNWNLKIIRRKKTEGPIFSLNILYLFVKIWSFPFICINFYI